VRGVLAADRRTPTMIEIATAIQEGAMAYLRRQFRTIIVILVPVGAIVFFTSTEIAAPGVHSAFPSYAPIAGLSFVQSGVFRTLAFIAGAFLSALTGYIGMNLAVRGNVRTAAAARDGSMSGALRVAFRTGGVAGLPAASVDPRRHVRGARLATDSNCSGGGRTRIRTGGGPDAGRHRPRRVGAGGRRSVGRAGRTARWRGGGVRQSAG